MEYRHKVAVGIVLVLLVIGMVMYRRKTKEAKSGFNPDAYNWPQNDQFGATGETYPYGNYSGDVAKPYALR